MKRTTSCSLVLLAATWYATHASAFPGGRPVATAAGIRPPPAAHAGWMLRAATAKAASAGETRTLAFERRGVNGFAAWRPEGPGKALALRAPAPVDPEQVYALEVSISGEAAAGERLDVELRDGGGIVAAASLDLGPATLARRLSAHEPGAPGLLITADLDSMGTVQSFREIHLAVAGGPGPAADRIQSVSIVPRSPRLVSAVAIAVDPQADRHPVNDWIYGVNWGWTGDIASQPRYPVRRWGGSAMSRYSWTLDVANRVKDYYFRNEPMASADGFIDDARAAAAEPMITLPTIGWKPNQAGTYSFSVARYGGQCGALDDAGSGVQADCMTHVAGNDPSDASSPAGTADVLGWLAHIAARVGSAGGGGVKLYNLDNEPDIWPQIDWDVHPEPVTYDELWQMTRDYAAAVKSVDPDALLFGPDSFSWCGFFWATNDCPTYFGNPDTPDHQLHGDFVNWYLDQVRAHETATGVRLIDFLDVHYYPENGVEFGDETAQTAALRLRSLKSLYDPAYADESWISQSGPIYKRVIPKLKEVLAAHAAPGTRLAIAEYNWGSDDGLSSALAQVESLGIFAREGVDLAARWEAPALDTRVEDAFRLFLDYDRNGARVGSESVRATSSDVDLVGAYALRDPAGTRFYLMLINKATSVSTVSLAVSGAPDQDVEQYGFDASQRLGRLAAAALGGGALTLDLPARSARLVVGALGAACSLPGPTHRLLARKIGGSAAIGFTWQDAVGATGHVLRQDSAANGLFTTVAARAASGAAEVLVVAPNGTAYYQVAGQNACGEGPRTDP